MIPHPPPHPHILNPHPCTSLSTQPRNPSHRCPLLNSPQAPSFKLKLASLTKTTACQSFESNSPDVSRLCLFCAGNSYDFESDQVTTTGSQEVENGQLNSLRRKRDPNNDYRNDTNGDTDSNDDDVTDSAHVNGLRAQRKYTQVKDFWEKQFLIQQKQPHLQQTNKQQQQQQTSHHQLQSNRKQNEEQQNAPQKQIYQQVMSVLGVKLNKFM